MSRQLLLGQTPNDRPVYTSTYFLFVILIDCTFGIIMTLLQVAIQDLPAHLRQWIHLMMDLKDQGLTIS